jgi:spore coat protein U-like protein
MTLRGLLLVSLSVVTAPAAALVNCSSSVTGVAFGIYNPLNAAPTLSTGNLTVTCTLLSGAAVNVPLRVDLSTGFSGNYLTRSMQNGAQVLNYNLYWSTGYTQIWGDGTGGSFYGVGNVALSPATPTRSVAGTMYGRMPAGQDILAGGYLDTIVVTVTY